MNYSKEVEEMCIVAKGPKHGPAPIPEEGKWVQAKEVKDISGYTHGVGWCAPQQGACKLSLNVKDGIIEEALVETVGCSGMTHSAAMAAEILPGKTVMEAFDKMIGLAQIALTGFDIERLSIPSDVEGYASDYCEGGGWMWTYDTDVAAQHIHEFIYEDEN